MKLFTKLFLSIFLSMTVSFTIYSITIINIEKNATDNNLLTKIKYNEDLYASSLSHLLYEVDKDVLNSLLNSIYQDKEIVKINLIDYSNIITTTLNSKPIDNYELLESKISLRFNNIVLGELEIYYTKKYIVQSLSSYKKNILTFSIFLTLTIGLILYFFINRFTSSLEKLANATEKIAIGDLSKEIHLNSSDEIGILADKFEIMRNKLVERRLINKKQKREIEELNEEMFSTQKILIETLGEIVEKRYIDDPHHIKRVAQMSYLLAKQHGLSEEDAKILKIVSPMHDVGKIGIPDSILLKPGKLTAEEFEIMKTHSTIGYNILKDTNKTTLDIAALVAYEHHEKWDGTGYPRGTKGEEISIFGRITGIIDVYDALANKRCYKDAWSDEEIVNYIKEKSEIQFDPKLVDLFLNNYNDFKEVQKQFK